MATTRDLWSLPLNEARQAAGTIAKAALDGRPRQHASMTARHGPGPDGATCGDCYHCKRVDYQAGTYFKCDLYGYSHGPGTDWRKKWPACGAYSADEREARRKADVQAEEERARRAAERHARMRAAYHFETGRSHILDADGWSGRGRKDREKRRDEAREFARKWFEENPE